MPLSNVNISLKQFQDISCGKFNAGEVRLRGANGLDKMSGLVPLNRGLVPHGVNSAEHAPVTYTLAKNPVDGAVTITYSEPAGFPFRFHWTVTVALDGTSSSTPMVVEK